MKLTVSPSVTRTAGPGIWPLNVQALYFVPVPSITISVSSAVILTSWVFADASEGNPINPAIARTMAPAMAIN